MITQSRKPLSASLLAAGLAVVGTIASFGATVTPAKASSGAYSATLAAGVAAP